MPFLQRTHLDNNYEIKSTNIGNCILHSSNWLSAEPQKNLNNKGFGLTRVTTERPCPDSALSPPRSFVVTLAETGGAKCPAMPLLVDRENSFEDLEQFLDQLEWEPSHDNSGLNAELTFDPSVQPLREESRELEVKALREHLKAIVKDIHISIGERWVHCRRGFVGDPPLGITF